MEDDKKDQSNFVTMAVASVGEPRRTKMMGAEYLILPAVMVREQVLHNNLGRTYLPAEEITDEWAQSANGAPVLTDHPNVRGAPASGRNPDILNSMGAGFVFNARVDGGALKADIYIQLDRATEVEDVAAILRKVEAGETPELSTGFPLRALDQVQGSFNGKDYDYVLRPGGFDHLAVFAEKIGACSVRDGCGLGVNEAAESVQESSENDGAEGTGEGADNNTKSFQQASADFLRRVLAFARNVGEGVVEEETGTVTPGSEAEYIVTDKHQSGTIGVSGALNDSQGAKMNREQMIAQLAAAGPLDKDALNKLSDCQLRALANVGEGNVGSGNGTADNGDGAAGDSPRSVAEAMNLAHKYRRQFEELRDSTKHARNEEEKERMELLDDLLFNSAHLAWPEDEVRAMDIVQLRRLHKQAFGGENFAARGGPRGGTSANGTAGDAFNFVRPIMSGRPGESVLLDRKEAN